MRDDLADDLCAQEFCREVCCLIMFAGIDFDTAWHMDRSKRNEVLKAIAGVLNARIQVLH